MRSAPEVGDANPLARVRERARVRVRELRQTSTEAEQALWRRLPNRQLAGWKFRRQHPIGRYFADFACIEVRLVVELDGGQHFEPGAMQSDLRRSAALNAAGFHVLRFDNRQALTKTELVLQAILDWLQANGAHPDPLPQAGEGATSSKDST